MYYPPSYLWHFFLQTSIFVYNLYSEANFCRTKFAVILFSGNLLLQIAKVTAKIGTRENLVPHGISLFGDLSRSLLPSPSAQVVGVCSGKNKCVCISTGSISVTDARVVGCVRVALAWFSFV